MEEKYENFNRTMRLISIRALDNLCSCKDGSPYSGDFCNNFYVMTEIFKWIKRDTSLQFQVNFLEKPD